MGPDREVLGEVDNDAVIVAEPLSSSGLTQLGEII
jgi:hypothetical protein